MILLIFLLTAFTSKSLTLQEEIENARIKMSLKNKNRKLENTRTKNVTTKTFTPERQKKPPTIIEIHEKQNYDIPKPRVSKSKNLPVGHYDVPKSSRKIQKSLKSPYYNIPAILPKKIKERNPKELNNCSKKYENIPVNTIESDNYLAMSKNPQDDFESWSEDDDEFDENHEYEEVEVHSKEKNIPSSFNLLEGKGPKNNEKRDKKVSFRDLVLFSCTCLSLMTVYILGIFIYLRLYKKDYTLSLVCLSFALVSIALFILILVVRIILLLKI